MVSNNLISREHVVAELSQIADAGIKHPDDLDRSDPSVVNAQEIFFEYVKQRQAIANRIGTLASELECNLDLSTIETDAGFTDRDYLDEVANDWLAQDEEVAMNAGLLELATSIRNKANELNSKISG